MYTTPSQAVTKHWWRLSTEPLFTRCHQTGRVTHSRQSASHQVQSPVEGEGEGGGQLPALQSVSPTHCQLPRELRSCAGREREVIPPPTCHHHHHCSRSGPGNGMRQVWQNISTSRNSSLPPVMCHSPINAGLLLSGLTGVWCWHSTYSKHIITTIVLSWSLINHLHRSRTSPPNWSCNLNR